MPNPIHSLWNKSAAIADATPDSRNRYVDFLRAASIAIVIFGHWLVAAPYLAADEVVFGHMLSLAPWTQWLTLAVQVMPIFFLVGGYANGVAWRAAQRKGTPYGVWLGSRFQRLIGPVVPVVAAWLLISWGAIALGAPADRVGVLSQLALVPSWFLAVYVMVGVLVPATHAAWQRYGFGSFAALIGGAIAIDALHIAGEYHALGYLNYAFVWLAVHQLGYAWLDGRMRRPLVLAAAGGVVLFALVRFLPYPLAMVGVPGELLGNTQPPTLALLALGVVQTGLVLAVEPIARRVLASRRIWTGTVLINGMIMSLYLWHMTAMVGVIGIVVATGGAGLQLIPDSGAWWAARPIWLALYGVALAPLVIAFSRFERPRRITRVASRGRLVAGASLTSAGLGMLAASGTVGATGGVHLTASLLPFVGTALGGFGPLSYLTGERSGGRSSK